MSFEHERRAFLNRIPSVAKFSYVKSISFILGYLPSMVIVRRKLGGIYER